MKMPDNQSQIIGKCQAIRFSDSVKIATLERQIRELSSLEQARKKTFRNSPEIISLTPIRLLSDPQK